MKLGIMQPYFLPYIGYFQLIAAVDVFVIYDNIKYTKKSWINRNRMLLNGTDVVFSLPLKKDSDTLDVIQRQLASDFDRTKLLNKFKGAYSHAPYFAEAFPLLDSIIRFDDMNLFRFIHHSLVNLCSYLNIDTQIRISSDIPIDHSLRNQERVLALCQACGANTYINAIGGTDLYDEKVFRAFGIDLKFIKTRPIAYQQFASTFTPWLSIVDLLMFNKVSDVKKYLTEFDLI